MTLYLHSAWVGKRPSWILVTAGGLGNSGLLTVMADVFAAEWGLIRKKKYKLSGRRSRSENDGPEMDFGRC